MLLNKIKHRKQKWFIDIMYKKNSSLIIIQSIHVLDFRYTMQIVTNREINCS
jgi:hypothetical protein